MAKTIQVSDDNGTNWYTLPGGSGAMNRDGTEIPDTIFGQSFSSNESGLIGIGMTANAFYKGFAGYLAELKKPGTPVTTATAATALLSGKTYQITTAANRVIDRSAAVVVFDNAVDKTSEVLNIDYLFGKITFKSTYTVTGPVTVTYDRIPMVTLGKANAFTLTQTAELIETSDFATVQANSGFRTFDPGLRTVGLDLTGIHDTTGALQALLENRTEIIIDINPDGNDLSVARGFFKAITHGLSGDVGALEEETISFALQVPVESINPTIALPFDWQHAASTTLQQSIQVALQAWLSESKIDARYLYDGTNGWSFASAVIGEVTLTGGLEAMNTFDVTIQADGVAAAVP